MATAFPITPAIIVMVPDHFIADVIVTAVESGHYGSFIFFDPDDIEGEYASERVGKALLADRDVRLKDKEDGGRHILTRTKFLGALSDRIASGHVRLPLDAGDLDVCDADALVQYAVFGKVVYA